MSVAKFLQQGYRYHTLRKTFSKFYELIYKINDAFARGPFGRRFYEGAFRNKNFMVTWFTNVRNV